MPAVIWPGAAHDAHPTFPRSGPVRMYDLAQPLEPGMPRHPLHPPFAFALTSAHPEPGTAGVSFAAELITLGGHVGTHVDALGHVACDGFVHGRRAGRTAGPAGHGIAAGTAEEIPPLVGPGHLVDAVALLGRRLDPGDGIGAAELERWFAARRAPGAGSIVLLRTGWGGLWDDPERYLGLETGLPGLTRSGAEWLSARGILAAGSDTVSFEQRGPGRATLDVHVHLLVESGIYILESLALERLAADRVTDFHFTAAALRLRGATGSPIRPLAIVERDARET